MTKSKGKIKYWKEHFGEIKSYRASYTNYELDIIVDAIKKYKNKIHDKNIMAQTIEDLSHKIDMLIIRNEVNK